jgi:hypothetical protein
MFDARDGLSPEVLNELRAARQVLPARAHLTAGHKIKDEQPLVIAQPDQDALWHAALSRLRPHQRVTIEWSVGWGGVSLSVAPPLRISIGPRGAHPGSLQLGRTVGPRIRRGQSVFRPYGQPR